MHGPEAAKKTPAGCQSAGVCRGNLPLLAFVCDERRMRRNLSLIGAALRRSKNSHFDFLFGVLRVGHSSLYRACVTSPTFGAMNENAVHLAFSDVHQQSSTVPTQKINRVQTGVWNRREVARRRESGRFHQSQLPLRMRHGRYLARIIRSEPRLDLSGNGLVLISIVPH
jgi:hypothetical protein